MIQERWTWIKYYGVKFLPKAPRKCSNCDYFSYFDLKKALAIVPPRPSFYEICPTCGNIVELKEGEDPFMELKEDSPILKIAKELGTSPQDIVNATFEKIIMALDPITGKIRFVDKDTGETIFKHHKNM